MWYEFDQNNSGGSFVVDDKLCHRVFIEADSKDEAVDKAESLGIYFNGVEDGNDCPCCGDRWYRPWNEVNLNELVVNSWKQESKKTDSLEEYCQLLANEFGWTVPDIRLYYKTGEVKEIFIQKKEDVSLRKAAKIKPKKKKTDLKKFGFTDSEVEFLNKCAETTKNEIKTLKSVATKVKSSLKKKASKKASKK